MTDLRQQQTKKKQRQDVLFRRILTRLKKFSLSEWLRFLALVAAAIDASGKLATDKLQIHFSNIKPWAVAHPRLFALIFAVIVLGFGSLASWWKNREQLSYGATEVVFGILVSYNALLQLPPTFDFSKTVAVGTAAYVIARGFNNLADARRRAIVS